MNIREAAERTGLTAHTIRFYEKSGLFPRINRSEGGIRQFTEADIVFLRFIAALKKTGMSLEDISVFLEDGCMLEQLQAGTMAAQPVRKRIALLQQHKKRLLAQREELDLLMESVDGKLDFYHNYLSSKSEQGKEEER